MTGSRAKTFLITGGASGIGAALARLVANAGDRVVIADINFSGAQAVAKEIGASATAVKLDICSESEWETVLDAVWASHGGLDVLVNNAAIVHTGYARDVPIKHHVQTVDVNFFGPMRGMLAALTRFKAQGHGHLVTVCSMAGLLAQPAISSYAASKHALRAFHLALAFEERESPVKFTMVHPTSTETPMLDQEAEDDSMVLAFAGTPVTAEFVAGVVVESIAQNAVEAFAPADRGEVVKAMSTDPLLYWETLKKNLVVGADKLKARRLAKNTLAS